MSPVTGFPVILRPTRERRPAAAWMVIGSSPTEWLQEIVRWGTPLEGLSFHLIPKSRDSRAPGALFVVKEGLRPPDDTRAIPFQQAHPPLFIPADAELYPALAPEDWAELAPYPLAVLHPVFGLIGFDEEDRLSLLDLVAPPQERDGGFGWAQPCPPSSRRLLGISALAPPALHLLFHDVSEEIGRESASELPSAPGEPKESGWSKLRRSLTKGALRGARKIAGGAGSAKPDWLRRVDQWAERRIDQLRQQQQREIQRLLHLLRTDPDQGLRYALPIGNDSHRGLAPPSARLGPRGVEFQLGRLDGGQAASPWLVDSARRMELIQQYREAANREIRLGRHRRAAYIFAELLRDYFEAANVLRQGGFHREASVLYLKHLGDKLSAARCLREGGFLSEAIPLYEERQEYEIVAELHGQLGREDERRRFYRLAVARALGLGLRLKAAQILVEKLDAFEEAVERLRSAWPTAGDAVTCLRHELELYQKRQLHERAIGRLAELAASHPAHRALELMDLLAETAQSHGQEHARQSAIDLAYSVSGRWLSTPSFGGETEMLALVRRLAPEDRLLARDTLRYREALDAQRKARAARSSSRPAALEVLGVSNLPNWAHWVAAMPRGREGLYALGHNVRGLAVMRRDWAGNYQIAGVPLPPASRPRMTVCSEGGLELVSLLGCPTPPAVALGPADAFPRPMRVENPPWCDQPGFLSMAYARSGVAWVLRAEEDGDLVLLSYSKMGDLIASHGLRLPEDAALASPSDILMLASEPLFIALPNCLVRFHRDRVDWIRLARRPRRITGSPPNTRSRVVLAHDDGAEVFFGDGAWGQSADVPLEVSSPCVAFTPSGNLLVASEGRVDLLEPKGDTYAPRETKSLPIPTPIGLFPTDGVSDYALITNDQVHRLQARAPRLG